MRIMAVLSDYSNEWSELTFFLIMAACFLAYKLRWKESTFSFTLAAMMFFGAVGKLFILIGPEPKFPLFLFLYFAVGVALVALGLYDRRSEETGL